MKRFNWQVFFSVITLVAFAGAACFAFGGLGGVKESNRSDQLQIVQKAVERAVVQCYALEGAYPPNIQYLKDNYGISIDEDRYFVHYQTNDIGNAMPDIQVFESMTDAETGGFTPDSTDGATPFDGDTPFDIH